MDKHLARVPEKLRPRFSEIVALTDAFCDAHLTPEFRDLCRALTADACKKGLPVTSGKAAGWAAGVVAAVGFVNFLGDPSRPFHMTTEEMARKIGVSPATLHNKWRAIRGALRIDRWDPRYSTRESVEKNPLTWILSVNGLLTDIRLAPRGAQEEAFRRGLIPYIPADGGPGGIGPEAEDGGGDRPRARKTRARQPKGSRPGQRTAAAGAVPVYTLDVSLLSGPVTEKFAKKNRSVIRTIQIRGDQTLEDLHEAIFDAFDRDEEHMYEFQFGKGPMDPKGPRYVLPVDAELEGGPPVAGTVDQTTIDDIGLKVGRQFGYWFDFGDDWHHQIGVVAIDPGPPVGKYPRVTDRVGESPPQYVDWDEEQE
ncbi:MAG: Plasmid pRiA4b ORF-3-like protein [Gemmataceae bacterium]|nr:Plasmid pRiA4b ORF-3-like protein [Gemmataceae bacterium]